MKFINQKERRCRLPAMFVTCMALAMFAGQALAQSNGPPERRPV